MIFAILFAYLAYRKASENGRSGIGWAFAALGVFLGTQFLVSIAGGIVLALYAAIKDLDEGVFDSGYYTWPIYLAAIVSSFGASFLLLKFLSEPSAGSSSLPPSAGPLGPQQ